MPPPRKRHAPTCCWWNRPTATAGIRRRTPRRAGRDRQRTVQRGGSVLLPAFAVGRAQALLLVLQRLKAARRHPGRAADLPRQPDGDRRPPRCTASTAGCCACRRARSASAWRRRAHGRHGAAVDAAGGARYPCVIISASGMATGGRVLHHLKTMVPEPRHHVVLPRLPGRRQPRRRLVAGATEVKIHGEYVPVRADVSHLEGLSGHADSDRAGRPGCAGCKPAAARRPSSFTASPTPPTPCACASQDELGWSVRVPQHGSIVSV